MLNKLILISFFCAFFTTSKGTDDPSRLRVYEDQPKMRIVDGHLTFVAAKNKDITFQTNEGKLRINGNDMVETMNKAINVSQFIETYQLKSNFLINKINRLQSQVYYTSSFSADNSSLSNATLINMDLNIRRLNNQNRRLFNRLNFIRNTLETDDCLSSPCLNGGTCIDLYHKVKCLCPPSVEGQFCDRDVNECELFNGTDLGCQNGATCLNTVGSFYCICKDNWIGVHCTKKSANCTTGGSELCGHGICVPDNSKAGYTCICDQGYTKGSSSPACTEDVNECSGNRPLCSVNPLVQCLNTMGSFHCGPCPAGYNGNGHYCSDIDECLINNGGCSSMVQCINTMGSRVCSPCPPGYLGNGETCSFKGVCNVNHGGCHSLAQCTTNSGNVECICPQGYNGNGIGPNGCIRMNYDLDPCGSNPCVHGLCVADNVTKSYTCACERFYFGRNCNVYLNPCLSSPCMNGGTCTSRGGILYKCRCRKGYAGQRCDSEAEACGGRLIADSGVLKYPPDDFKSIRSNHLINCAWVITTTNSTKVLQINFTKFQLNACSSSFIQMHDGKNSAAHAFGRFCGQKMPSNNGTLTSTHNVIYLWFSSSFLPENGGFELNWTSIDPVCNTFTYVKSHGSIQSPGYPGLYPPNRDCYWHLFAPMGKRLLFQFYALDLGNDAGCDRDYIEFKSDGWNVVSLPFAKFCNTSKNFQPSPIYSVGPDVSIHFHSDAIKSYSGFLITYSMVEGIPGCGGTFQIPEGEIQSPGVNGKYLPALFCEYRIIQEEKMRIKITFTSFDVENVPNCAFDYVAIYEGKSPDSSDSSLVGKYCGSTLPVPYTSLGNVLTIVFKSDVTNLGNKGFKLQFETICGQRFTDSTGIITTPGSSNKLLAVISCVYEIVRPLGNAIVLNILDFNVDGSPPSCSKNAVEIRDGDNANSTLIGRFCDKSSLPNEIVSTHNYLWIRFNIMTINTRVGLTFKANYTSIDLKCGGILKDPVGTFSTPSSDGLNEYLPGVKCQWVFSAPPGYVVQITWMTFRVEKSIKCVYDRVLIYDNNTDTTLGGLIGQYCGSKLPPTVLSSSNILTVIFISDETLTEGGFAASYTFIKESNVCGGNFFTNTGFIKSPGYPQNYPRSVSCAYTITVKPGSQIMLDVIDFQLEYYNSCKYDYLEIRNGGTQMSPEIGKYCGDKIPKQIPSQSNKIYLQFSSDFSKNRKGFYIKWSATASGCGGTVTSPSGSIISPHYPEPYSQQTECYWKIAISPGSRIQMVFADLDLESQPVDYVEIFDGLKSNSKSLGRFYNKQSSGEIILTTANHAFVKFHSDISLQGRGFNLQYTTNCTNKLTGFGGVIESPNFPNGYTNGQTCLWEIEVTNGNKVKLIFSHFDLENDMAGVANNNSCLYDHIEIDYAVVNEDYDTTEFKKLGQYCGTNSPGVLTVNSNIVKIKFITDEYLFGPGFRMEWALEGCGGLLIEPNGKISSPNYPKAYPSNVVCQWKIQVDYGKSIELTFDKIDIETSGNCIYDSLHIYDGPSAEYNELAKICHFQNTTLLSSSGNFMFVSFAADASYAGMGFTAHYKTIDTKCGGHFAAAMGTIYSPNYPKNYGKHETCEYLIEVDDNHVIVLEFQDIDIVENDLIKVFDGPTQAYPLLQSVNATSNRTITSSFNQLLVEFRSLGEYTAKGFKATYKINCGIRIDTQGSGIIKFDQDTMPDEDLVGPTCTYTISAANPVDHVTLSIYSMVSDNTYCVDEVDYPLHIYGGDSSNAPLLKRFCESKLPPPIVSSGSSMHIELKHVKYFYAKYSVFDSVCGGTLMALNGFLASPNYPKSHSQNRICEWTIQAAEGNYLSLSFEKFSLLDSENCNTDFLEVRRMNSSGQLLGVFCGSKIPSNIKNLGSIWLMFKASNISDLQIGSDFRGFYIEYNISPENSLNGTFGVIQSALYPAYTISMEDFSYLITVRRFSRVLLTFTDFYMDSYYQSDNCFYSYMEVFDGGSATDPILQTLCGLDIPKPITTTSNKVFIKIHHTPYYKGVRFSITWKELYGVLWSGPRRISNSTCGGTFDIGTLENTTFTSPGYPNGYSQNLNCTWIFSTPPMNHLHLTFLDINLSNYASNFCIGDYIMLYNKNPEDQTWKYFKRFCRINPSTTKLIEMSSEVKLQFITNSVRNETGFKLYVFEHCGGTLNTPSGYIVLSRSTVNFNCQWNITVRAGKTIVVRFESLNIPITSPGSCTNYVLLRNGHTANSPILRKFCGTEKTEEQTLPPPVISTGNTLYVSYKGSPNAMFKLKYEELSYLCDKDIILTNSNNRTEIMSPNYPNVPPTHIECKWRVRAPPGETIRVDFEERFDLSYEENCEMEYVEIRDGGTELSPSLGRFCNTHAPSTKISSDNIIYIKYFTNLDEPKNGFKAAISITTCGGALREHQGEIVSPSTNKPITCIWSIIAPEDFMLDFQFTKLSIINKPSSTCNNNVTIIKHNPYSKDNITMMTYCDSVEKKLVGYPYETNRMTVIYNIANPSSEMGFNLNYTSVYNECGGLLTSESGIITTPGYPLIYPKTCRWKIQVPLGRRITVKVIDADINVYQKVLDEGFGYSNSHDLRDNFQILKGDFFNQSERILESSENKMTLIYWSDHFSTHRGLLLEYTSNKPTVCVGDLSGDTGTISTPNVTKYVCTYERTTRVLAQTVAYTIVLRRKPQKHPSCIFGSGTIIFSNADDVITRICAPTVKPKTIRSIYTLTKIIVASTVNMTFNISYKTYRCGGQVSDAAGKISTPQFPNRYNGDLECSWLIKSPGEISVKINFTNVQLLDNDCDKSHIVVYNGDLINKPRIGKFCGPSIPYDVIKSQTNSLLVEYMQTSDSKSKGFSLSYEKVEKGCGGILHDNSELITSPNYPNDYSNDAECLWDIVSPNGYYIQLDLIDRFHLEDTTNCTKDFLEIYDWYEEDYHLLSRVCGRQRPNAFNSTSNKMRILFRSDSNVTASGFKANWKFKCGGVFQATNKPKRIVSPGFPDMYPPNLICVYDIIRESSSDDIKISFDDFMLESRSTGCEYDNLTIRSLPYKSIGELRRMHWSPTSRKIDVLCGHKLPVTNYYRQNMQLIFKTDKWVGDKGFSLTYQLDGCNFTVTEQDSNRIQYEGRNYRNSNGFVSSFRVRRSTYCDWNIIAPPNKIVILNIETLSTADLMLLSPTRSCIFDALEVYNGLESRLPNRLAMLCGKLNSSTIHSSSNKMLVKFKFTNPRNKFSANIEFVPDWCGKDILLNNDQPNFRHTFTSQHLYLNCIWTIIAQPSHNILFQFSGFDALKGCTGNNATNCDCGLFKIHDGLSFTSPLIEQICISPQLDFVTIKSSGPQAYLKYFFNTPIKDGMTITVTQQLSPCGILDLTASNEVKTLTSPNYPNPYPSFLRCRWKIRAPPGQTIAVRFNNIDLSATPLDSSVNSVCASDSVEVSSRYQENGDRDGLGSTKIISGNIKFPYLLSVSPIYTGQSDEDRYIYCGVKNGSQTYDYLNRVVDVQFVSRRNVDRAKGFSLTYDTFNCRNYTEEQGRIVQTSLITNCYYTIRVPENRTISLYFNNFFILRSFDCVKSGLEIRETDSTGALLLRACGFRRPESVFSKTNKIWINFYKNENVTHPGLNPRYDMTYTSSDNGRGCGGQLFSTLGRFTSPLYPNTYTNTTLCTWTILGAPKKKILLRFYQTDFRGTCEETYLKVIRYADGQSNTNVYCAKDWPAMLTSDSNIIVQYQSGISNTGTGFMAGFRLTMAND